jgi:alpha-1,3-mannosyltransferase
MKTEKRLVISPYEQTLVMFSCLFLGMVFSRGSHQQFYYWYSFTIPFLADAADFGGYLGSVGMIPLFLLIELGWMARSEKNAGMSLALQVCHFIILAGLMNRKVVTVQCESQYRKTQIAQEAKMIKIMD